MIILWTYFWSVLVSFIFFFIFFSILIRIQRTIRYLPVTKQKKTPSLEQNSILYKWMRKKNWWKINFPTISIEMNTKITWKKIIKYTIFQRLYSPFFYIFYHLPLRTSLGWTWTFNYKHANVTSNVSNKKFENISIQYKKKDGILK